MLAYREGGCWLREGCGLASRRSGGAGFEKRMGVSIHMGESQVASSFQQGTGSLRNTADCIFNSESTDLRP